MAAFVVSDRLLIVRNEFTCPDPPKIGFQRQQKQGINPYSCRRVPVHTDSRLEKPCAFILNSEMSSSPHHQLPRIWVHSLSWAVSQPAHVTSLSPFPFLSLLFSAFLFVVIYGLLASQDNNWEKLFITYLLLQHLWCECVLQPACPC